MCTLHDFLCSKVSFIHTEHCHWITFWLGKKIIRVQIVNNVYKLPKGTDRNFNVILKMRYDVCHSQFVSSQKVQRRQTHSVSQTIIILIVLLNKLYLSAHIKVRVPGATIARKNTCVINKLTDHTSVLCSK